MGFLHSFVEEPVSTMRAMAAWALLTVGAVVYCVVIAACSKVAEHEDSYREKQKRKRRL